MVVGIWDGAAEPTLDAALVQALLGYWWQCATTDTGEATALANVVPVGEQIRLGAIMRQGLDDWSKVLRACSDEELVGLTKFFALAEVHFMGWEAGKRSPAIACARELRSRGSYPPDLTRWLRRHSNNRFLPYGSLLDGSH